MLDQSRRKTAGESQRLYDTERSISLFRKSTDREMEAGGGLNQSHLSKAKLTVYLAVSRKRRTDMWIDKMDKIKAKTDKDE